MKRTRQKYFLLGLDLVAVNYAFLVSLLMEMGSWRALGIQGWPFVEPDLLIFVLYSGVVGFIFVIHQLYAINVYLSVTTQLQLIVKAHLCAVAGLALLLFFTGLHPGAATPRVIVLFLLNSLALIAAIRILVFRTVVKYMSLHDVTRRNLLIVGATPTGREIAEELGKRNVYGLHPLGFVDEGIPSGTEVLPGMAVLGRTADIRRLIRERRVDELVLCLEDEPEERYLSLLDDCANTRARVVVASKEFGVVPALIKQERYGDMPVFGIMNGRPYFSGYGFKRAMDVVLAGAGILALLPVFVVIALGVKLDSPGPVFYRQVRLGRNGRPFNFYKFRSMRLGSDADTSREKRLITFIRGEVRAEGASTKIVDEGKVTRMGRFIRKTSLDELPQLFNVVRGDMSLVGPRPCLPYEWKSYAQWHKRRLSVNPGCTGVWQVSGRSKVGFRDMVVLDLYYIYNMSFHLDVWLMLRTIPVMIFGTGGK